MNEYQAVQDEDINEDSEDMDEESIEDINEDYEEPDEESIEDIDEDYEEPDEESIENRQDSEAPDEYTEVSVEGWGNRIGGSLGGIVAGIILILISVALLWWNEGRAVKTAKSLKEGSGAVVAITADKIDSGNEGKLVHLSGLATTDETLSDPVFNVSVKAITLTRSVEMYQWQEKSQKKTEKKVGGKEVTTTTYTYDKGWHSELINSSRFKKRQGHKNPAAMPYANQTFAASKVTIGAFTLPLNLARDISGDQEIPAVASHIPADLSRKAQVYNNRIYVGRDPSASKVGDVMVSHKMVQPQTVSIIAKQVGSTFEPYQTSAGNDISMLKMGTQSPETMFEAAISGNALVTWVLRVVGFVIMFIGFKLILGPLVVLADVLPIIGMFVGVGTSIVSFLVSAPLTLITIAIAWVFYRPVLGVILLVVAAGGIAAIKFLPKKA